MMKLKSKVTLPAAGMSGFETPMSDEETGVQAVVHRFAREVLRPLGTQLDKMTAAQVIAPGSPYWSVFAESRKARARSRRCSSNCRPTWQSASSR